MTPRVAFHIGYHKTASTWFQREALPRHGAIGRYLTDALGEDPFLHMLVLSSDREFDPNVARRRFEERILELDVPDDGIVIVSEERLSGHAATGGYDTFRIAERIAAVVPEAQVFFVVRDQVDMIESEYLQLIQEGSVAPLEWLLGFRPRAATVPGFELSHYEYDRLADHYTQLFGRENVRLFEFRAMTRDPRAFLDHVSDFLGIEPWPQLPEDVLTRRVNPTLPRRLLGVRRFFNHFERRPLNPHPLLALPPIWRGPLWWLASRLPARRRSLLDSKTQTMLREHFGASNLRLGTRYGVDFGHSE